MSSLIVADVALAYPDGDSPGQSYPWIEKRILDVLSSAERRFEALVLKNERVIRLHDELRKLAEKILTPDYHAWKSPESAAKEMELFFRKADRFRIVLIQSLLEENEMRLLEAMYVSGIQRFLSDLISESLLSSENPVYLEYVRSFQEISTIELHSERLVRYKSLISDLATVYYSSRDARQALTERINTVKKEASSLELQNISLPDLAILHDLQDRLSALADIPDIEEQNERLSRIEEAYSVLAHRVSGIEHTSMPHPAREEQDDAKKNEKIADEVRIALLTMEAEFFHGRIRFFDYDETEGSDYEPVAQETTPERLMLQRENLQLEYGLLKEKIPEKTVIREELEEIVQNLSLDPDAGALLDAALLLYHDPFPELRELSVIRRSYDAYSLQKKSKSLSDVQWAGVTQALLDAMMSRGYRVTPRKMTNLRDSFRRGNIEVFSPATHYSVLISINPLDEVVFRLVRIIDGLDIDELDPDQIQKENALASSVWDQDFEIIRTELKERQILLIERLRKGPEEVPVQQLTRFDLLTDEHIS
ncbi:MAG TPA: hypothetical protein PK024_10400 [Methanospirillum sp.]|uniref:hypothetical protein n=1 Tax=Methanospirillum sp. TaxID=45200 RepID=UPI002C6D6B7F|nr:hypothetical protein [Methanospirillum sp.]HOJ97230.1 hypothetical protein [Methanospirillum sp.]HOL40439.1 hypothetical protein [Methanospirillum sp.]HPP78627.1 hypothetical protein [Methanospirillum sp.]